jgi:predicted alpha/beta-hydrolase family hydrolase
MQRWAERLAQLGEVELFDYRYMREKQRRPDRLPDLIAAHREALAAARVPQGSSAPVILAGKSMGGRIGCHVSLEEPVTGLVCFGYPLCGGGDPVKLRDKVLRALTTPVLFLQGTRDPLCPLDLLEQVRSGMQAPNFLHIVEGGDHSLVVGKRQLLASGETQADVDQRTFAAVSSFIRQICETR